jgi:hypothetical protein
VYLFGGQDGPTGAALGDTWMYDGTGWTLVATAGPPPRFRHAMAALRGRLVVFGGMSASGPLGDTWTFDGNSWTQVGGTGPSPRQGHAMATLL